MKKTLTRTSSPRETKLQREIEMQRSMIGNYHPNLLIFMLKAAKGEVMLKFPERRLATTLRQKMYKLRERMRRVNHPDLSTIERMELVIKQDKDNFYLIGRPVNTDFLAAFEEAGITIDSEWNLDHLMEKSNDDIPVRSTTPPLTVTDSKAKAKAKAFKEPSFDDAAGPYGNVKLKGEE